MSYQPGIPVDLTRRRGSLALLAAFRQRTLAFAARFPAYLDRTVGTYRNVNSTTILMYHRIAEEPPGVPAPTMNVTPERFHAQMAGLIARGFRPARLADCVEAAMRGQIPTGRRFVVTFDDGFASVAAHAAPILERLNIPATVFLATAYLGSDRPFPFDDWTAAGAEGVPPVAWRPLTPAEIADLDRRSPGLIEWGCHTHTHQDFRGRPEDLRADLARSLAVLRDDLGRTGPIPFAFPYGSEALGFCTPEMLAVVREAGLSCGLTTTARPVDGEHPPFGWGRIEARSFDTDSTLAAKLGGWFTVLDRWCRP